MNNHYFHISGFSQLIQSISILFSNSELLKNCDRNSPKQ